MLQGLLFAVKHSKECPGLSKFFTFVSITEFQFCSSSFWVSRQKLHAQWNSSASFQRTLSKLCQLPSSLSVGLYLLINSPLASCRCRPPRLICKPPEKQGDKMGNEGDKAHFSLLRDISEFSMWLVREVKRRLRGATSELMTYHNLEVQYFQPPL